MTFKQFIWSCFSIPAHAFFHSVDDLRRTLCITMGLSITFSLTKWHANFCKMLFLKSLGFAMSLLAGGCPLTAWARLRSSSKDSCRRQSVLTEDALFNGYAVVGWALTYPKQKVLLSISLLFFFFFCMIRKKAEPRKVDGKGARGHFYISHICTMLNWSSYHHLEKLQVVDLWLKCVTGVGVLLAKSLKWGLSLCEGISCSVLDAASPILDHV